MTTDEAYYWIWSLRPQLSYYDHPPFVAWLFSLGHVFESFGQAIRWPGVLLGHGLLFVWFAIWRLTSSGSQENQKFSWWLWLVLCSPLLGFGSLIVTPDLPVLFFWSASLYFSIRVLKSKNFFDYALLGVSLGLGFCAKYHIVLFVLFLFVYLTVEKKWKEVRWHYMPATVFLGLLFSAPVLLWNWQNNFVSFRFQLKHGLSRPEYHFYWTWSYVLAQIMMLFPSVVWAACQARPSADKRIFLYFGWGPLFFFFLSSFKALVEVNWPIVAYPALFALATLGAKKIRLLAIANAFWVLLFSVFISQVFWPWIPRAPERLSEFSQFEPLLKKREAYHPLYASTYQMASWIWYETKNPMFKLNGMSRFDLFDTFPEGHPQGYPIYIAMKRHTALPEWIENNPQFKVSEVESLENDFVIIRVDQ